MFLGRRMADAAADRLKVFISYSRDDIEFADQLAEALDVAGFDADLDRHGISGGEEWKPRLSEMIARADTIVFALSPRSAGSPICRWEVEESHRLGKRLLPAVVKPLGEAAVPQQLVDLNYIHFYAEPTVPGSGFGGGLKRLASALKHDIAWVREATRYGGLALSWEAGGRPQSRLLSGADIGLAKGWLERKPADVPEPPELVREFVKASEAAEQARSDAELARVKALHDAELAALKAREEAAAAAAAKAKAEAEAARRLQHRTAIGLVAALVLALAAGGMGWWAFEKQAEAERNAAFAEEQRSVAVAQQELAEKEKKRAEAEARTAQEAVDVVDILDRSFSGEEDREQTSEQRDRKVFEEMRAEAEKGNRAAMRSIGQLLLRGKGAPADRAAGLRWWERAAAVGDVRAMKMLAVAHRYGSVKDNDKARQWYEKAAAAGDNGAMVDLGGIYETGEGVPQDYAKAREWYEKAVADGHSGAMVNLGLLHDAGRGVPQSATKAREWYEKAGAAGDSMAMGFAGSMYLAGRGAVRDFVKAREWYEKGAAAGDSLSMLELGRMFAKAEGVPQDYAKAREWYEKAAPRESEAMSLIASLYADGLGVPQDHAKAREWLEKAAAMGDSTAMIELGRIYAAGTGVPRDFVKTREWDQKADAAGNTSALDTLAWHALIANEPAQALDAAERALMAEPWQLWTETNHAHALMYLGRAAEAKTLYLAHKGETLNGEGTKTWEQAITEDFAELRKAGLEHPQMAEIEAALGIGKP